MDLGTYLSQNWALIAAHPLLFVMLGVIAATLGWGAAALLFRHRLDALKERAEFWKERAELATGKLDGAEQGSGAEKKAAAAPPTVPTPAAFSPSSVQTRIIRVLRQLDGQFLSIGDLARFAGSTSHQDLVDDIHGLHDKGWLEAERDNDLKREHARAYRLKGPGLAFARASGFQTAQQIQLTDNETSARPGKGQA